MIAARWKKVLADLWSNKTRSLLVVLSIAVGVFAVGVISSAYVIIRQDMAADYLSINPHTARIYTDPFDDELLSALSKIPEVTAVDGRYDLAVKINAAGGKQVRASISTLPALQKIKVDQIVLERGAPYLGKHEIYLERQGAAGLGLQPGDFVDLLLANGQVRRLKIAGTVHDVHANPYYFTGQTSGYVDSATMEWLGGSTLYNYVMFTNTGSHTDEAHVSAVAQVVANKIQQSGREVYNVVVNHPGQHPAQNIIDTVLALMGALGVLAVFLSGFLVANTLSALMSQQIRQIGVMKAFGATLSQVASMYLTLVLAFGILALLVAMPLSGLASYALTRWFEGMLNANTAAFHLPGLSLALQMGIGLVVPLASACVPVVTGARRTVREAISSQGLNDAGQPGLFDHLLNTFQWLSRPLLLSLRNTFRRKARMLLTLGTLTLGGAIFISVISVRESMYHELDQSFGYFQSDLNVDFLRDYPVERLQEAAAGVPGVVSMESWKTGRVQVMYPDREIGSTVFLFAPPSGTQLVQPVLSEGRWLLPQDENAIVVDHQFASARPDVKLGAILQVRIEKRDYPFRVVGIFKMAGSPSNPYTYANYEYVSKITHAVRKANSLRIVTDSHSPARQTAVMNTLQTRFEELGMGATLQTGNDLIAQKRSQVNLLIYLLLFMAVLIAVVGGLGLMGTMSMNVLERTREIGVMRSIGARNRAIFKIILSEGLLVGSISWALSIALAVPMTRLLDRVLGVSLLSLPLDFQLSMVGMGLWLGGVLALAALASFLPARSAVRLTVRDVLSYE